ncbi:glycosyltransferase family 4 protein [Actinomycetospora endophytica]|uniref:Glycosyltransferase family 4 protein n=1 Tax=Actinomycetospora endophytica TaxID=2291215 RepID=A0ABS8PD02_9PSEU|nr:glycosyltransferase family 4 protein [Actinomycetospora endophytica]MCD2196155.1 glycosyltransferase family 4 protein [Actinomycetospora endophytica]
MKIVWIGPLPPPVHGASVVTRRFLETVGKDHAVTAIDIGPGLRSGITYHFRRIWKHLLACLTVCRKPDRVYVSLSGGMGLWYEIPIVLLSRLVGVKLILHHHSYAYLNKRRLAMSIVSKVCPQNARHLLLTSSMADSFRSIYKPLSEIVVLSNANFVEQPAQARGGGDHRNLVHVSNLSEGKGTVRVIEVWQALRLRHPDVRLSLVGPCEDRELRSIIQEYDRTIPEFSWLGPQDSNGVQAVLQESSWFLFPTSYANEAAPMVLFEALAAGVPVLASARGAISEIIPQRWLVNSVALEDFVDRYELVTNSDDWTSSSEQAFKAFEECQMRFNLADLVVG